MVVLHGIGAVLGRDKGWKAFTEDIETFCRLLRRRPTHQQIHYLLRVQHAGTGSLRMSLPHMDSMSKFQLITWAALFRAAVHGIPSFLFYEHEPVGRQWLMSIAGFGADSVEPLRGQFRICKDSRYLVVGDVRITEMVGPFSESEKNLKPGKQDIILTEFQDMPTDRIEKACQLTRGSILYVP